MRRLGNAALAPAHAVGYALGLGAGALVALWRSLWLGIRDGWAVIWR